MHGSWRRASGIAALVILALALIAASCVGDDGGDWSLADCETVKLPDHEDPKELTVPGIIIVDLDSAPGPAEDLVGSAPVELIDLAIDLHEFPDGFSGDRFREILPQQQFWNAVDTRVEAFQVPQDDRDDLLAMLRDAGFDVAPLHLVGYMGHWSAYPGTTPEKCVLEGELPVADPGAGPTIGVIDTGLVPGSTHAATAVDPSNDLHMSACDDVSHGEFVAEMITYADPAATVVSGNAFRYAGGSCWETTEVQLVAATSEVLAATLQNGGDLDAMNFSLGAVAYEAESQTYEPLLTRIAFEVLVTELSSDTRIYAAAGNSDSGEPISPAMLDGVISVAASDANDSPTVWDENGQAVGWVAAEDPDLIAPGCDLVAVASGAGEPEVVVWSGSSFASPLAAAILADSDIDQDEVEIVMPPGTSIASQC